MLQAIFWPDGRESARGISMTGAGTKKLNTELVGTFILLFVGRLFAGSLRLAWLRTAGFRLLLATSSLSGGGSLRLRSRTGRLGSGSLFSSGHRTRWRLVFWFALRGCLRGDGLLLRDGLALGSRCAARASSSGALGGTTARAAEDNAPLARARTRRLRGTRLRREALSKLDARLPDEPLEALHPVERQLTPLPQLPYRRIFGCEAALRPRGELRIRLLFGLLKLLAVFLMRRNIQRY